MYKVLDVFKVANMLSVTLEGNCDELKNGTKLVDENNKIYSVVSVAMTRHDNPSDISKSTTVLITPCDLKKGNSLRIA
ncbi:MAG: hypothetical protein J6Q94_01135 [Clostridia bacterium]|nr:hypothetical protein [Clostridia bacterium]